MIKKFKTVKGKYIEKIIGQDRFAYAMSDNEDFYDLISWSKRGGYQGSVILFYDFDSGEVYQPFEKKRNTVYSRPIFADGYYYFLQGCYDENRITLFKYFPDTILEQIVDLKADEVDLYNLQIVGSPVHIISHDDNIKCYYPKAFTIPSNPNESVCFIEDEKIYIEAWVEEGWDYEDNCATNEYDYYEKIVVKDFSGNILSEEVGALHQCADGTWWIS